ncbi:unnamed protein product [Aphanomyces euteiches]
MGFHLPDDEVRDDMKNSSYVAKSVAALFRLRYNSHIPFRFNSKNNNQKGLAFSMLASELSTDIRRTFTAKQVQEKLSRLKSEWACSTPKKQKPTGNDVLQPPPAYYDLMQEYWGSKQGYRRESLLSTDDTITCDSSIEEMIEVIDGSDQSLDTQDKKVEIQDEKPKKQEKISFSRPKAPSNSAAIESGLFAIKDGLIALGNFIQNQNLSAPPMQPSGTSLDDVLAAIQSQSNSMMSIQQPPPPPPSSYASLDDVLSAIQSQTNTMAQLIAHLTANKG